MGVRTSEDIKRQDKELEYYKKRMAKATGGINSLVATYTTRLREEREQ